MHEGGILRVLGISISTDIDSGRLDIVSPILCCYFGIGRNTLIRLMDSIGMFLTRMCLEGA